MWKKVIINLQYIHNWQKGTNFNQLTLESFSSINLYRKSSKSVYASFNFSIFFGDSFLTAADAFLHCFLRK